MRIKKRFLGFLLSIALILGLMPGMSLTAYADGTTYNPASTYTGFGDLITNDTEVTISEVSGKTWYVIANDSSTVTLLSKESFGRQAFNNPSSKGNTYATSDIKAFVDGLTGEGKPLAGISSVISDLTLIDTSTAQELSGTKRKGGGTDWWLRSPGNGDSTAKFVDGRSGGFYGDYVTFEFGVRPALKLDLSSVIFESESKTFSLPVPVELTTDNKPTISTTKAAGNTDTKPQIDDTLTATTTAAPVTYQWYRDGEAIEGATESTYTLTAYDLGKAITVTITQEANAVSEGHPETNQTQTSEATASVVKDDAQLVGDVNTLINALPAAGDVTTTHKTDIEAARAAYDALTDTQKSKVSADTLKKLTDAEAALAEVLKNTGDTQQNPDGTKNTGDTQQNPDGTKTVTKENADGKTISVTNYSKTDEQISQFVFKKANGTKLDLKNVNSKSLKTVVVPATVKANGKTYKVTRIRKGFLKNCKQATKVDIALRTQRRM